MLALHSQGCRVSRHALEHALRNKQRRIRNSTHSTRKDMYSIIFFICPKIRKICPRRTLMVLNPEKDPDTRQNFQSMDCANHPSVLVSEARRHFSVGAHHDTVRKIVLAPRLSAIASTRLSRAAAERGCCSCQQKPRGRALPCLLLAFSLLRGCSLYFRRVRFIL